MPLSQTERDQVFKECIERKYKHVVSHPGVQISAHRSLELQSSSSSVNPGLDADDAVSSIPNLAAMGANNAASAGLALSEWTVVVSKGGIWQRTTRTFAGTWRRITRDPMQSTALLLRTTSQWTLLVTMAFYALFMVDMSDDPTFRNAVAEFPRARFLPNAWGAYGVAIAYVSMVVIGPILTFFASRGAINTIQAAIGQLDTKCVMESLTHPARSTSGSDDVEAVVVDEVRVEGSEADAEEKAPDDETEEQRAEREREKALRRGIAKQEEVRRETIRAKQKARDEIVSVIMDDVDKLRAFQLIFACAAGAAALMIMTMVSRGAGVTMGVGFAIVGRNAIEELVESNRAVTSAAIDIVESNLLRMQDRPSSSISTSDIKRISTLRRMMDSFVRSLSARLF